MKGAKMWVCVSKADMIWRLISGLCIIVAWLFGTIFISERSKGMNRYIDAEELIRWIKESQQMTSKVRAIIAKIHVMENEEQEHE